MPGDRPMSGGRARGCAVAVAVVACLVGAPRTAQATAETALRVATPTGVVQGVRADGVAVFRGLPYAAAPVGARRWRAPQPAPRWQGVRSATRFGPACPQKTGLSLEGGGDPGPQSEDCLSLNVWTPRAERSARLPVLVWLHGGALTLGAGSLAVYDGSALARQGLVVVTLNYRLGPLGYFVHPALERAAPGGPVNFGLLDQIAALHWVQRHIADFGGDPHRVTLAGQSAGAQSVLALIASPPARGLFQRAIAQSPYGIPSHTRAQARQTGVRVAEALGLAGADVTAAQLRALPAERLVNLEGPDLSLAPSLIVGDAAMPRSILSAYEAGQQAAVPLIVGSNSDEASVALAFGLQPAAVIQRLGTARLLVGPLYPGVTDDAELGRQVVRDAIFTAYVRRIAVLQSQRATTWRYYDDRVPSLVRDRQPGVPHGGEVPAVFGSDTRCGCLAMPWTDEDRHAAQALAARWVAFARDGRPAVAGATDWPPDRRWQPVVFEFGDPPAANRAFMRLRLHALIGALKIAERRTAR